MNAKPSAGPWRVNKEQSHPWAIECPTAHRDIYGLVCFVAYRPNAHLIAQTPALLAFASQIARLSTDEDLGGDMPGDDAVATLCGLIYKARELVKATEA